MTKPLNGVPVVLDARVVSGSGGGPDKTILNSPRFLDGMGYRMLCAYMHAPDDPGFARIRERAEAWNAPLIPIPDGGAFDWRVVPRLLRVCREHDVAIWHGHDYKSDALGLLLRPLHKMKLVTTVHGWGANPTRRSSFYNRIDRLCLPRYERVICVSQDIKDACLSFGVPEKRCVLIENGIDTKQFSRTRTTAEAKQAIGFNPSRLLLGAVGRLSSEKGFDVLIRAFDQTLRRGIDAELILVGDGDRKEQLQAIVEELGRADRVRLLGYRSDTIALYEAMDALALSSFSEGLPNALLEAMAMEVPVLSTRIAGVPKLIRDGENGILVEPRSVEDLAEGLTRLLGAPALQAKLRAAGRLEIEANYSFAARMAKIRDLYDELLAE